MLASIEIPTGLAVFDYSETGRETGESCCLNVVPEIGL